MRQAVKHIGLHSERLAKAENRAEVVYASEWAKANSGSHGRSILLHHLLAYGQNLPGEHLVTARDAETAATVIQWLGSEIGQDFIRTCQQRIEKRRSRP